MMRIVLTGVETNNKGAELMLYAVLKEVEHRFPDATVFLEPGAVAQGLGYLHTKVKLRYWPLGHFVETFHLNGILNRLHLPHIQDSFAVKGRFFLDGSGFRFSDQCQLWGTTPEWWEKVLKRQYNNGARIVFLPQAFGPIELSETKRAIGAIGKYASLIMPRDMVSLQYLEQSDEIKDKSVIRYFPDFTITVDGVFPSQYAHLKDGICVIPNMKMIDKGSISYDDYLYLITSIVKEGKKSNHPVYLLNHEGVNDERLAFQCQNSLKGEVEVVTGLNALEVKGLISSAYLVVTSRFHGLASALNSCVPSLATSWSHKYVELLREYFDEQNEKELSYYLLPLDDISSAINRVAEMVDERINFKTREMLQNRHPHLKKRVDEMWEIVWNG